MKKIITFLAIAGLFTLQSCTTSGSFEIDPLPVATSEVFEVNASFNSTNNYSRLVTLNPRIYSSDVVLVYRLTGITPQGSDIWKLLPETHYFADGTLDFGFDYDYTTTDVSIFMIGNNLQTVSTDYRLNQVLRIVITPAGFSTAIDKNNINAVMSALNVDKSQIKKIDL
ncbi:hypothetical protein [Flavobacterium xinjiangense]|jgi:hypothetical protein|uniref:Dihydrolipoamide dehydrogenase n=1 Tax=Flavobacterium xinjiangense TaxID=178356 RepID=A0A1M7JLQ2_9FLAO|nr:hypothetical protein [Flavobacterium xinjiangense]SHM53437.1 hypothetical protein SAMN05216269_1054 [Flavobacterium xinjiangense]